MEILPPDPCCLFPPDSVLLFRRFLATAGKWSSRAAASQWLRQHRFLVAKEVIQ